ncbi:MAG: MFS transporter, partial [candidate division KSB1 bacterium]|nr:MFS transporter [candidate division KSB1 bacterium]
QIIFGFLIAIFTLTMVLAGKLELKIGTRGLGILSAVFFSAGYFIAGFSRGNFALIWLGIAVFAGMGTGFGYLASLTAPVRWFPEKKGLITGIAAAGFGLAATLLSLLIQFLLKSGKGILQISFIIGALYGTIILVFAFFLNSPRAVERAVQQAQKDFYKSIQFWRLLIGIFLGTFAGLLVIGSLKSIGLVKQIDDADKLAAAVSIFAVANFLGRIGWGYLSDRLGSALTIFLALSFQAVSIFLLGMVTNELFYLVCSAMIGFGFGGNFVLFARETGQIYGVDNLGRIYPFVFLGYGIAGIFGPLTAGALFDWTQTYDLAITIASIMSLAGALIYLRQELLVRRFKVVEKN